MARISLERPKRDGLEGKREAREAEEKRAEWLGYKLLFIAKVRSAQGCWESAFALRFAKPEYGKVET